MIITTYHVSAPYFINGHKNINGLAIADDINNRLRDADCTEKLRCYEDEIESLGEDGALYGLEIKDEAYNTED